MSDYIFKAKTVEAYTIKSLVEVLQNILTDVCFVFNKDGIKLLTLDNKIPHQLMIHLKLNNEAFDEYYCADSISVGINLQYLYRMLKSIKKKDNILLYIKKDRDSYLDITTIQSDSGQPINSSVKIQKLEQIDTDLPTRYNHPIHIPTNTYQKMCKDMQNISPKIKISSVESWLEFSCYIEGMCARNVPFGDKPENSSEENYYEDFFHTKSLNQLIKVSGLNNRMQVYVPDTNFSSEIPIKFSINTGHLGKLDIYIKSANQINTEINETIGY